jgi:two-component system, LytTR family, sensor kinase
MTVEQRPSLRRPVVTGLVVLGAWLLVGAFNASRVYLNALYGGPQPDRREILVHLYDVLLWAALTPVLIRLARQFPLESGRWRRSLPMHVLAGTVVAVVGGTLNYPVVRALYPARADEFTAFLASSFHFTFQWYWIIIGIGHAVAYYAKLRDRDLSAARLETQLARAELGALKMQMQPHFLFNTLNAVSELVHEDPMAAEQMILRLARLLRMTVDSSGAHEVPLRQEVEFLEAFLTIEQIRFRDRLAVDIEVRENVQDALVPGFILQPLVENALKHGFPDPLAPQRIEVRAGRCGDDMFIEVLDNGTGFASQPAEGARLGVGIANTRARLRQLYGERHKFEFGNRPKGGAYVRVVIPFEEQAGGGGGPLHFHLTPAESNG